jgi:uncharacterized protein YdhG (YjbR/CyaY superfamily)
MKKRVSGKSRSKLKSSASVRARPGGTRKSGANASSAETPAAKPAPATVAEYLARVPEPARSALNQIRAAIRSVVPEEATEVISYKIPAFKYKKVLVWYAAFANHCSLFPTAAIIEQFKDEFTGYTTAKGTVQFPLDKPMPTELIKRMVKARVE